MLFGKCIFRMTKELCLLAVVMTGLLGGQSAIAFAPRTIHFGENSDASSEVITLAIIGEISKPATYRVAQKEVTVGQIIRFAGGSTDQAGKKIRVLRGGKSILVLLRSGQEHFKLSDGDVVILDRQWQTSTRTVSFDNLEKTSSLPGSVPVVNRANSQRSNKQVNHGQVVLLGLAKQPVVLPLWGERLTIDTLLKRYMKQSQAVVAGTRILVGQKRRNSGARTITAGMVLSIPNALLNRGSIPQLPAAVSVGEVAQENKAEQSDASLILPVKPDRIELTDNNPLLSSSPDSLPLIAPVANEDSAMKPTVSAYSEIVESEAGNEAKHQVESENLILSPFPQLNNPEPEIETSDEVEKSNGDKRKEQQPATVTEDVNVDEAASFTDTPITDFTSEFFSNALEQQELLPETTDLFEEESSPAFPGEQDLTTLLEEKMGEAVHTARAGEIVPNPMIEAKGTEGPTMFGFIAGAFVVIGVMTVIISALRNQFTQTEHRFEDQQQPVDQMMIKTEVEQSVEAGSIEKSFSQPSRTVADSSDKTSQFSSDPLTRAKQKDESLDALLENRVPIIEERVLLPRELKFFGKPHLYYEFRLDSSHDLKKPHLVSAMKKIKKQEQTAEASQAEQLEGSAEVSTDRKRKQSVPVYWEAETGMFVSSCDHHLFIKPE